MGTRPASTLLFSLLCVGLAPAATSSQPAGLPLDVFRDTLLPSFNAKFLSFVWEALQNDTVTELFRKNLHVGSGRRQGGAGPASTRPQMGTEDLKQLLNTYKVKVDRKYSAVLHALRSLKQEFEKSLQAPAGSAVPGDLQQCCEYRRSVPQPARTSPGYRYEGRHRDDVNVSLACVGKTADTAGTPFSLRAEDAFAVMKTNYDTVSSVLWQYVATLDGHYVQFPTKNRSCDDAGHSVSPLHQRWLVDKLLQQKLHLVILLDAGEEMNSFPPSPPAPGGPPPVTHLTMAKHAARTVVSQLAFVDRVSVVVMNGSSVTPPGCTDRLMIATDRNQQILSRFIDGVTAGDVPQPGLAAGFQTAYSLLRGERNATEGRKDTNDVILLLTNGEYVLPEERDLLDAINTGQDSLGHKVTHLVYLIKAGDLTLALDPLVKVADLNNLKLDNATRWPGHNRPVGPVGLLMEVPEGAKFRYADTVGDFYRFFPRGPVGGMDRIAAVSPHRDPHVGLLLTYATPIYNDSRRALSSLHGMAALDVSMASLLDDLIHFRWRRHSYAFLVERERGVVLVHPKMDNPARPSPSPAPPVFSDLTFLEPTLTPQQRARILGAGEEAQVLDAEIVPGRTTYRTGLDLSQARRHGARVAFSLLPRSDYVLVMVIFSDELAPLPDTPAHTSSTLGFKGLALYHHQLVINHTAHNGVCASSGDLRVKDKLTVKFSPEVFTEPEVYMNSQEAAEEVANMADFLTQDTPAPPVIRPEALSSVVSDLRVVSSLSLSRLWVDTYTDGVVERFIGTPSGVFAAYPGISLPNAFDGKQYAWYRESVARPGGVWVTLHRSFTTPHRRLLLSTTLGDSVGLFGAVAAAVSRRSFAGLFLNTVEECLEEEYSCHLMTTDGYLLDMLDQRTHPGTRRHLTSLYPWLANVLIQRHLMKPVWCTVLSRGRHNLTYVLTLPTGGATHSPGVKDACRHFLLWPVQGANLLVLVLTSREGCRESASPSEFCSSCRLQPRGTRCSTCLAVPPSPPPSPPTPLCQCPCSCNLDFNRCQDSFRHSADVTFPMTPCFEEPALPALSSHTATDEASAGVPPCDQLCPAFEKKEDCEGVEHCQWGDSQRYPVCRAHLPSTTPPQSGATSPITMTTVDKPDASSSGAGGSSTALPRLVSPQDQTDSELGGGAIAGIMVGVAVVLAAGFLIGYYRLIKPRLFTRLTESESVAEGEGRNSAHYTSQSDTLDLSVPPLGHYDVTTGPQPPADRCSHSC